MVEKEVRGISPDSENLGSVPKCCAFYFCATRLGTFFEARCAGHCQKSERSLICSRVGVIVLICSDDQDPL